MGLRMTTTGTTTAIGMSMTRTTVTRMRKTNTGMMMMSKPNIQQVPIPGNPGREIIQKILGVAPSPGPWPDYPEPSDNSYEEDEEDGEELAGPRGVPL